MRRRPQLLVAALLAFGLLAVGCGDDDEDKQDDSPATTQSAPPAETATTGDESGDAQTTTEAESEQPAGDGADPYAPGAEIRQRAAEACKQSVQGAQQLSAGVRSDLEEICEKAAEGDEEDLREASREVCERIIEESVPAGPGREQALASCKRAG